MKLPNFTFPIALLLLFSCNSPIEKPTISKEECAKANKLLDEFFDGYALKHPMLQTTLGIKTQNYLWDDINDSVYIKDAEEGIKNLDRLKKEIDFTKLDKATLLSCKLYEFGVLQDAEGIPYVYHSYPITQMFGMHTEVPSFLANYHTIETKKDADDYLSRLEKIPALFRQLERNSSIRAEKGIVPPKFVFPKVLNDCKSILQGIPFDKSKDTSVFYSDFVKKVKDSKIPEGEKETYFNKASLLLTTKVRPAYQSLIQHIAELEKKATTDDGAWKFPSGNSYYAYALKKTTTTSLTPDEVYSTGEKEVARIHEEMRGIMKQVNFQGELKDFFKFMKEDPRFYYENSEEGKKAYLTKATAIIDSMRLNLDKLFTVKPKAAIVVKSVEPYREKTSAFAFYQEPSPDGTRPGVFYVSTYDMKSAPMYKMEALAYHEGIPGHHMQIALTQEMKGIPKFRKFGNYQNYMAYIEGWALYTEKLPKEYGFYTNPYSDFGRLSMELMRAVRLVVDAGIHSKKWTREKAIQYFQENTPISEFEAVREVERYIVWPSQATAYKVGMIKILSLREKAKKELGNSFDIRKFNDKVLSLGAVPLTVLEEEIDFWISEEKTTKK